MLTKTLGFFWPFHACSKSTRQRSKSITQNVSLLPHAGRRSLQIRKGRAFSCSCFGVVDELFRKGFDSPVPAGMGEYRVSLWAALRGGWWVLTSRSCPKVCFLLGVFFGPSMASTAVSTAPKFDREALLWAKKFPLCAGHTRLFWRTPGEVRDVGPWLFGPAFG